MKELKEPEFPSTKKVSKEAKVFIRDCLKHDPKERLQIKNSLKHHYFVNMHF